MSGYVIRPARSTDLPTLTRWLGRPAELPTQAQDRLLVAETSDGGTPLRASLRLVAAVGMALPRVSYHVGCTVHAAQDLGLFHQQRTLFLGHDHTGASELADVAWEHEAVSSADQAGALRALVAGAIHSLAQRRELFGQRLVSELPGPVDSAGQSPFWQGLGRHFYAGDPAAARAAHGLAWRSHVASLLPRHPLYISFLPGAAQNAIAQVHPRAQVLLEVLEAAGLRYGQHVNVEDAGPIFEILIDDLPAFRSARASIKVPQN